jgi:hypothetical protein
MSRIRWLTVPLLVGILLFTFFDSARAVPMIPSSFYGEIHVSDGPPSVGDKVDAYLGGVKVASATIFEAGDPPTLPLLYAINVPGDDDASPQGQTVTFKIGTRIAATGVWQSGTNVPLNLHPPEAVPGGPYTGTAGEAIDFSGSAIDWGTDVATYKWDWAYDGITFDEDATGPTPSNTWTTSGTKTVGLKVTDAQGGQGFATIQVSVSPATAKVYLDGLSQVYDGSAKPVTVTTDPPGLTVTVTYDGSAPVPVNAGSYVVVATIVDPTYSGSASDTLIIDRAPTTTTVVGGTFVYDGSPHAATVSVLGAGLSLTPDPVYSGNCSAAPVNVADTPCTASYTYGGGANYYGSSDTKTITITPYPATVTLSDLTYIYDGSQKSATVTTIPASLAVSVTYNGLPGAPTNAGNYTVLATVTAANYSGSATDTLAISKATASVTLGGLSQTYDGSAKSATATTDPVGLVVDFTYDGSGTKPTNAGSYAVVGTINDLNYAGSSGGTLVIGQASSTTVVSGGGTFTYNGSAHAASVSVTGAGSLNLTPDPVYSGNCSAAPVNVADTPCTASYSFTGDVNHTGSTGSTIITITTKPASVTPDVATKVYGDLDPAFTGTLTGFLAGDHVTATYARAPGGDTVLGGPYTISATLSPSGVLGNYNITYNTAAFTITAKPASVTPDVATKVYGDLDPAFTGTLSGFLEADGVTATYARAPGGNTVLGGPYTISATLSPSGVLPNYNITYNTAAFTITPAAASVALSDLVQIYDGTQKSATATTTPPGLSVSITYDGSTTAPTAAGSYAVIATITDTNYSAAPASGTLLILATHSLSLVNGWNLVSFSVHPLDTSIATVLSSVAGHYDLVYAWDATGVHSGASGNWMKYDPTAPPYTNTLDNLDEKMGFWIHMTSTRTVNVVGSVPASTNITLLDDVGGWNLVAYPSAASHALPEALRDHGVGTDFSLIFSYRAADTLDPWKLYDRLAPAYANDLTQVAPGWGYWVMVSADHMWDVPYAAP